MTPTTTADPADTGEITPLLVCSSCGTVPAPGEQATARLTWSKAVERGRATWTCGTCSRNHLRAIESQLDTDWW